MSDIELIPQGRSRRNKAAADGAHTQRKEVSLSEEQSGPVIEVSGGEIKNSGSRKDAGGNGESGSGKKKGKEKKSRLSKTVKRIIAFAIAEVLVLTGIFSYAYVARQYNKIQRPEVNIEAVINSNLSVENIEKMKGYWNIAVFGVDSRDSSVGKGNNADVIIIVSVNRDTGEIKMVSVFRDTYMGVAGDKYNKINYAYCVGGPEQALKALNEDLDLNITQYATFNWKAVATAINILGGVDVELSKAEFYYINSYITATVNGTGIGSVQLAHAGPNHLDGVQAVAYARLRYMDNDYARTERQRKIIQLCFDKAKQTDVKTLTSMIGVMLELVATNMTWQDGLDAIADLPKYHISDTGGFPFARGEAMIGKLDAVVPQTLESNVIELHRFLFNDEEYVPSDMVKNMSAYISSKSGMYKAGENVGHVSTSGGYIPKPTQAAAETQPAESTASSEGEKTETEEKTLTITGEEGVEYTYSKEGYLIYVAGTDDDGKPTYKYVFGDDGKRIKIYDISEDGTKTALFETGEDGTLTLEDLKKTPQAEEEGGEPTAPGDDDDDEGSEGPGGPEPGSKVTPGSKSPSEGTYKVKPVVQTEAETGGPGSPSPAPGGNDTPGGPTEPGGEKVPDNDRPSEGEAAPENGPSQNSPGPAAPGKNTESASAPGHDKETSAAAPTAPSTEKTSEGVPVVPAPGSTETGNSNGPGGPGA